MKTLTEQDHDKSLPFSEAQQEAIVGYCLLDSIFFLSCIERIKPSWFTYNPLVATIFDQLIKFYRSQNRYIKSPDELLGESFFLEQPMGDREKIRTVMANCMLSTRKFDLDTLKRYLTGFIRISMFKESIQGAASIFKIKGFDDAYSKTKERLQEIEKATFEEDSSVVKFANADVWLDEDIKLLDDAISTGSSVLDKALGGEEVEIQKNGNTVKIIKGGFMRGEATAIMAPTNAGKTTLMLTSVRHAIYQGKNVLLYMHEGRKESIRKTLLAGLMGVNKRNLKYMKDKGLGSAIKEASEWIDNHVTYVHYVKSLDMYVEDIIEDIKKRNAEFKLKTNKGYDLIVNDYPGKLHSRSMSSRKESRRIELAYIYDAFNMLAGELQTHCLVAVQTNRAGYKANKTMSEGDNYSDIDDIAESYGVGQNMANMIALNRSDADKKLELMHLTVIKSREDITHRTVHTRTDFACGLTHGDSTMFQTFGKELKSLGLQSWLDDTNGAKKPEDADVYIKKLELDAKTLAETVNGSFGTHK